jgi:hypothetical protein
MGLEYIVNLFSYFPFWLVASNGRMTVGDELERKWKPNCCITLEFA